MLGAIAGQGGFDTKGKTSYIASSYTTGSATVVNVTGSGYLIAVGVHSAGQPNNMSITIDGVSKYSGDWLVNAVAGYGLTFLFRFESSLNVTHSTDAGANERCTVSYILD